MSQENVDRLIAQATAFNRLSEDPENPPVDALRDVLEAMDPECRFEPQQASLEGGYLGHGGVMRWLADIAEHYSRGRLDYDEVRDLGDRVLALGTLSFTGRGSGLATQAPVAIVANFRDGLITSFRDYGDDEAAALGAAGLSG